MTRKLPDLRAKSKGEQIQERKGIGVLWPHGLLEQLMALALIGLLAGWVAPYASQIFAAIRSAI